MKQLNKADSVSNIGLVFLEAKHEMEEDAMLISSSFVCF